MHDPARAHSELDPGDVPAAPRDGDHVPADLLRDLGRVQLVAGLIEPDDAQQRTNLAEHVRRDSAMREIEHLILALRVGVVDHDLEEEAVELRLRKLEHVAVLVWVLRRDHEERIGKLVCLPLDRHLPLLHRLEQRGLRARRRPVDLVGQEHVREDRAGEEDLLPIRTVFMPVSSAGVVSGVNWIRLNVAPSM